MPTTIYIGPYVDSQRRDNSPPTANRQIRSFTSSTLRTVLRQTVSVLRPARMRLESTSLFVLELIALGGLAFILAALLAGAGATLLAGLILADILLGAAIFAVEFHTIWIRHRRNCEFAMKVNASEPLSYRFVDYRSPMFDDGQAWMVDIEGLRELAGDVELEAVPADKLSTGDVILIESGQRIPADGAILEGTALVDEAIVTGQSDPVIREVGRIPCVMRDTEIVAGRLIVEVAPQRGHPLDWHSARPSRQSSRPGQSPQVQREPQCF